MNVNAYMEMNYEVHWWFWAAKKQSQFAGLCPEIRDKLKV